MNVSSGSGIVLTWDSTRTPSRERCRSISRAWVPAWTAPWTAAKVFSGNLPLYPRWEMICGRCGESFPPGEWRRCA